LTEKDWLYIPADIETPEPGLKFGTKILADFSMKTSPANGSP